MKQFTVVPMPQPGHQMCGILSIRRNGSTGFTGPESAGTVVVIGCLQNGVENLLGTVHAAARVGNSDGFRKFTGRPRYFARHLAEVDFGHYERLHSAPGELLQVRIRKRPDADQPDRPTLMPFSRAMSMALSATREVIP